VIRHQGRYAIDVVLDYQIDASSPILLAIEALADDEQRIEAEALTVNGVAVAPSHEQAIRAEARYRWINAIAGRLHIAYQATVAVERETVALASLPATPLTELPPEVAPWLLASRYCDPVQFQPLIVDEFGLTVGHPGDGVLMERVRQWVHGHIAYQPVSDTSTTAGDTFIARAGVCRDFSHLIIAFARAAGVPARFVGGYAWQLDPPDFHAVAELWLDGRWHLVDATGLAPTDSLIRIARSADGVAASFMTIFGSGQVVNQRVSVSRLD
jgi:transglutaminase-like putative cysteine protease